jgi:hypothetical protein
VLLLPKNQERVLSIGGAWRLTSSAPIKDHQNEPNFWAVVQGPEKKRQENGSRLWCLKKCQESGFLDAALPSPGAYRLHFPQIPTAFTFSKCPPSSLFSDGHYLHFS